MLTSPQLLLIDKPANRSSFSIVAEVRKLAGIKRVGHCGTLDPFATGLLIVLVGRQATKHQDEYLHMPKTYECTAQFGWQSDSYDFTGEMTESANWSELSQLTESQVETAMAAFRQTITQQVPAFSAVKRHGQKLYNLALRGTLDLETLPFRTVEISQFELTSFTIFEPDKVVLATFTIHCSSGTYVRSLIHDLGNVLHIGAVLTQLRRTSIGPYTIDQALQVSDLNPDMFKELHE